MYVLVDCEANHHLVEHAVNTREKASLQCLARDGAGDWLGELPSKGLGLHIRREEFCMAGRYCLGISGSTCEGLCPAPRCPRESDRIGYHCLSCAIGEECIAQHNYVRQVLYDSESQANLAPFEYIKQAGQVIWMPSLLLESSCATTWLD